ncbi:DUF805 domain-containing protein [Rappaport israeli]|uniref:DUF805 domain-containing protein n=1 Tax=Rappaport israeli TaxID=1839807 RepID=UPI000A7F27D9|nr:DUF805 domain-containing protein [Rappaport israeli]
MLGFLKFGVLYFIGDFLSKVVGFLKVVDILDHLSGASVIWALFSGGVFIVLSNKLIISIPERMMRLHYVLFIGVPIVVLFSCLNTNFEQWWLEKLSDDHKMFLGMFLSSIIVFVYLILVVIFMSASRFRDINSNPALAFLLLVPFVHLLVILALCFLPGTVGKNQYGEDPKLKGVEAE